MPPNPTECVFVCVCVSALMSIEDSMFAFSKQLTGVAHECIAVERNPPMGPRDRQSASSKTVMCLSLHWVARPNRTNNPELRKAEVHG